MRIERREAATGDAAAARRGSREAYWGTESGFVETPVFDRYRLEPGSTVDGPAIVEEHESTVLVPPGSVASVDRHRNLVIDPRVGGERAITGEQARL